jgi:hypothetical protein
VVSLLAWGNAPGFMKLKNASAESAIHFLDEFPYMIGVMP